MPSLGSLLQATTITGQALRDSVNGGNRDLK